MSMPRPASSGQGAASGASSTSRLLVPDAIRAVAAIAVIGIHAVHWPSTTTPMAGRFWNGADLLFRYAVPTFVILSGVLLQRGYAGQARGLTFLGRRFGRSLVPWFFWAPIYCVAGVFLTDDVVKAGGLASWWQYGAGHLWFLLLVPQLYMLFAIWPRTRLWLWAGVAVAIQLALGALRILVSMDLGGLTAELSLWKGFLLFPFWIGYFAVGIALAEAFSRPPQAARRWIVGGGIGAIVSGTGLMFLPWASTPNPDFNRGTGAFLNPFLLPFTLSMLALVAVLGSRVLSGHPGIAGWAHRISGWSLGIYIVHPLLLDTITGRLLSGPLGMGLPVSLLSFAVLMPITFALSMVVVRLLAATPLAATIGVPREPLSLPGGWTSPRPRASRPAA